MKSVIPLLACVLLLSSVVSADSLSEVPVLKAIPEPMKWLNSPAHWTVDNESDALTIISGKSTDLFISPVDGHSVATSPMLLFKPGEGFSFSAKVSLKFRSQWDAGVLVVYIDETTWAKLCFEKTVEGKPSIVTVVTRGFSDDSNSIAIEQNSVYLKVATMGQGVFFYSSQDGKKWSPIRAFTFAPDKDLKHVRIGMSSQSPIGEGSAVTFSEIKYVPKAITNIWTGD